MSKNKDLDKFVRDAVSIGKTLPEIEEVLLQAGWDSEQIKETLNSFSSVEFPIAVPRPVSFVSPRLFFLNLGYFLGLYVSLGNALAIGFVIIDLILSSGHPESPPWLEVLSNHSYDNFSVLLICVPLVFVLHRRINQAMVDTEQKIPRIRLNLIYFTVFIGAFITLASFSIFVYRILQGSLTLSFCLKIGLLIFVMSALFVYFRGEWQKDEAIA